MTYLNNYTTPTHWRGSLVRQPNRCGRTYVANILPGKVNALSMPLWLILKRMYYDKTSLFPNHKVVKDQKRSILINGSRPKDTRTPVMIFDHIHLQDGDYRFEIFRQGYSFPISFRLIKDDSSQKLIIKKDKFRTQPRISFINGERKPLVADIQIAPGSIWTKDGILSPLRATRIVRLTGKTKFIYHEIMEVSVEPEGTYVTFKNMTGQPEKILVTWQMLEARKIALIL